MTYASVRVCAVVLCALVLSGTVSHVLGQTERAAEWSSVMITVIRPDARAEYEAIQKEITAAYKKAGVRSRAVLQTMFGNVNEYVSIVPITKFAELDGAGPMERVLGAEGLAKMRRRLGALTVSTHRIASLAAPDLSLRAPTPEPAPYAQVVTFTLAPGKAAEYDTYLKNDYLPMLRKGEVANFWVSRSIFGGEGMERVTVRPLKKLAEIDEGPIARRVLGAEEARKLNQKAGGMYQSVRYRIVKYRPELSFQPEPARVSQR
jgi:hypothetical protein